MADDRPVLTDVEQIAAMQRQIDDLRSTVLARAGRSPTGTIEASILPAPKPDTLFLQGQIVQRASFPALWQWVLDNNLLQVGLFGPADGSATFGLPDMRGRVLVGAGTLAVGALVGADSVTLAINQMPAHQHNPWISVANHANHSHTFNTNNAGAHSDHAAGDIFNYPGGGTGGIPGGYRVVHGDHSHGGATTSDSAGSHAWNAGEDIIGGGQPVDVRQASVAVNWAIWT